MSKVEGMALADGTEIRARTCVLTTGTFLNGRIRLGDKKIEGGRYYRNGEGWEPPTSKVGSVFAALNLQKSNKNH